MTNFLNTLRTTRQLVHIFHMLRLYFLRHAKAKTDADLTDIDRPLAERGRLDAAQMASRLTDWAEGPNLVLCSAAQRARETLAGIIPSLNGNILINIEVRLYTFDPTEVLGRLAEIPQAQIRAVYASRTHRIGLGEEVAPDAVRVNQVDDLKFLEGLRGRCILAIRGGSQIKALKKKPPTRVNGIRV